MNGLIEIVGFFLGDGFWLDDKIAFSNTNEDLIGHYAEIISKMGFKVALYKRTKKGNRKDEYTLVVEKKFSDVIRKKLKNIWLEIHDARKSKAFLKGIFDAEGSINFASTRRGREIKITNTEKEIISLVRFCLERLKIPNKITLVKGYRPNRKLCFNIKTYGKSSIKFIKTVKPYKILSKNYLEGKVHPNYLYLFQ